MNQGNRYESLEKRLEALTDEHSILNASIANEIDPVRKERQKRHLKDIIAEMDEIDEKLKALSLGLDSPRRLFELQSKLFEIDFKLLEETIRKILKEYGEEGCAALLLFQKSARTGGEWCAARIRELLRRETNDGRFRHISVEFQPAESADEMALLRRLGQYLSIEPASQDPPGFSQQVVKTLCGSLQNGSVVLIECRQCDYLSLDPVMFRGVLDFWGNMVRELARVAKEYYEVKVITLLFVDGILPEGYLQSDQCCTVEQFQKDKLLEIVLEAWTWKDIRDWIARYAGLSLRRPAVDLMAHKVYGSTDGLPTLVVHELLKECCPITAR